MATQVHDWIVEPREHKRAIIWVSRASPVFDAVSDFRGSEVFAEPAEFCVRLTAPLHASEIARVEVLP